MSKPVRPADITTVEGYKVNVSAIFDSGSFYTIVREDCLPKDALILRYKTAEYFGTAQKSGKLLSIGSIRLIVHVEGHYIKADAEVCPELSAELIIGAREMQSWDITIQNDNGKTTVHIGHDMNDPDIQTVL